MRRGSSMVNFLWLLLVLFSCATAEEHSHRHHEATAAAATATTTTSAPGTLKQQQRLLQLQQAQENGNSNGNGNGNDIGLLDYRHQHPHHHLRHEQHLRAELAGSVGNRQPPSAAKLELEQLAMLPGPGQQHHLRHHNRHHAAWEQRVFPALRHQQQQQQLQQQHRTTIAPATYSRVVTDAPPAHSFSNSSGTRYFDRDGIYAAWMQPRATRAPNWQQLEESYEDGDDDDEYDEDEDEDYDEDADDAATAELAKQMPRYSLFSQKLPSISSNEEDYDAYDQTVDVEVDKNTNNNKHPSVANGHAKAAAKRNVFDWLFKRDKEKVKPQPQSPPVKPSTTEKPKSFLDDNLNDDGDDGDNDEAIDAFSNEQWNKLEHEHKIQHEHYMNKQKHQKEIEALRARNRNTPLIRRGSMRRGGGIDNEAKAAEGLLLLSDTNNNGHNANADNNYSHNYIPGKLTELKNKQLGNPKAVSNSRRGHNPDSELAEKHYRTVMEEAMCHEPQMRCMRVERDPSKIYRPHCTKLFRCSEDSGCCRSRSEICAPKEYHEVELTFYVSTVGSRKSTTEKLSFVNHTKCHCIERTNFYNGALSNVGEMQQAAILNCNCPKLFEKIIQNDGKCRCDCTSSSNHCAYLKTGIEHFSMKDRKCIHQGICKAPTCQYGNYMEKHGRCPNENEQSNYNAHNLS
ncbi:probable WRKY transcription factor protein 1 isoform X1 [Drosophila albomicans]|uniref:Probable WRKY transcription factor protein 1 isoform X1 n=1 Tax=Drosophila albomicans TaxID=7291 RepID=A0A6P8W6U6_DROAB|nr:probable WRKY transcription factor protein 1 isoform X1 [Drosophila albomicans]